MCWFYSVPNLLVFQQLDTLYLGGNNVRVVCEKSEKNSSVWAFKGFSRLDLASDSRLETRQNATHVKYARSWRAMIVGTLQDKNWHSGLAVNSWLILLTSEPPKCPVLLKKWISTFLTYPTINTLIPTKCRELLERILRENLLRNTRLTHPQSYTFDSQIPLLSPSPLTYPWEVH